MGLDLTVLRTAATAGLILIIPSALIFRLALSDNASQRWSWLFFTLLLAGFAASGVVAARLRTDTPMLHGVAAALLAFAVTQVVGVVASITSGNTISVPAIAISAILAALAGASGALAKDWLRRRTARLA